MFTDDEVQPVFDRSLHVDTESEQYDKTKQDGICDPKACDSVMKSNPALFPGASTSLSYGETISDEESRDTTSALESEDHSDSEIDMPAERLKNVRNSSTMFQPEGKVHQKTSDTEQTRFRVVSEADIGEIKLAQHPSKHTMEKTIYHMNTLYEFFDLPEISESREINQIPIAELSSLLCRFLLSVRKKNGDEYEPSCLRGMICSFDRVLRSTNYEQTIVHGKSFVKVRETLSMKQSMLHSQGKGNRPQKSDALTDEDVEKLWSTGQLGSTAPDSMLQTLWFYNTVYFGLRNGYEHRDLCWGDVTLETSDSGQEFLQYKERQSKNKNKFSNTSRDVRLVQHKIWANVDNPDRCPVNIYKLYSAARPADYSDQDHPFYIAAKMESRSVPAGCFSFTKSPVGINKLATMMKRMVKYAGLKTDKKLSNSSVQKYLLNKLHGDKPTVNPFFYSSQCRSPVYPPDQA